MKTVHKSVLIWYSAAEMFALVTDVASYPEFLPWCDRAQILSDGPDGVLAEAQAVDGMAANPFERFKLSLVASVVAICGGSQYAGVVFLELALFFLIFAIVVASLWVVGRVLWHRG